MKPSLAHIGIAVKSLDEAIPIFSLILGKPPDHIEEIPDQKVRMAVYETGVARLELLEATEAQSPVAEFIGRRGTGIHHFCLAVDDVAAELKRLKKAGVRLIDEKPRKGGEGRLIAFLHPQSTGGVLIELSQNP